MMYLSAEHRQPRVLFIAYACAAGKGSEWGMAWNLIAEIARTQDVWILTHADNQDDLEQHLRSRSASEPVVHVRYVRLPDMLGWMRNSTYALLNLHYRLWQEAAGRVGLAWHREVGFDVVQHVSYCRWWMPSAGAKLAGAGVRFVFGPVAGGDLVPRQFVRRLPGPARFTEWTRHLAREMWARSRGTARTVRAAAVAIPSTPLARKRIAALGPRELREFPCVALGDPAQLAKAHAVRSRYVPGPTLRLVSVGGVTHYRGVDVLLHGIARSGRSDLQYVHGCGGIELPRVQELARSLRIDHLVTWLGETTHARNIEAVATADVYVHLTLRDNQGLVLEAQSMGIPAIAFDHNSSSLMVPPGCGHRVKIDDRVTPEQAADEVAAVLRDWCEDRELLRGMSANAIENARQFSHAHRGQWFRKLYAELAAGRIGTDQNTATAARRTEPTNPVA